MAVLTTSSDELAILSVDGLRTPSLRLIDRRQVALAPGEHVVMVRHSRNGNIAEGSLTVAVQAGRRYALESASRGYHVGFWIEEIPPTGPLV
jgi:hypothetical protein